MAWRPFQSDVTSAAVHTHEKPRRRRFCSPSSGLLLGDVLCPAPPHTDTEMLRMADLASSIPAIVASRAGAELFPNHL